MAEMKIAKTIAVALVLMTATFSSLALAKDFEGVSMPDKLDAGGKSLALNGMGLRTKFFFKVYVAGLYVETPSKDAAQLVSSDQVKRVRISMLRDLSKDQIAEGIREGFEKNSKAQLPALQARLDKFIAQIPDIKKGELLELTYTPGAGTTVTTKGGEGKAATQVDGKDFADALFSVWLGKNPVDEDLKKGMLGTK